jgi:hypothetical protein
MSLCQAVQALLFLVLLFLQTQVTQEVFLFLMEVLSMLHSAFLLLEELVPVLEEFLLLALD